jgi:flagellar protein FlaG
MSTNLSPLSAQRMPPVVPLAATAPSSPAPQVALAASATPATAPAAEKSAGERKPAKEQVRDNIREATDNLNQQMRIRGRKLSFEVDEESHQIVVTVKDINSGDVIRQIPSEALLRVAHNIDQIKGLLHNELT